jgi:hypothetical protein
VIARSNHEQPLYPIFGRRSNATLVLIAIAFLAGCGERPLQLGSNWMPKSVGGPIEIRPLPPAGMLAEDYRQWDASTHDAKVRLYEVTIENTANQTGFASTISKGETPVGRRTTTFASFIYSSPTNGSYRLEWMVHGKQNPEFIRVGTEPKKFLLSLTQIRDVSMPRLQIVAIEGVQSDGVIVATTNRLSL